LVRSLDYASHCRPSSRFWTQRPLGEAKSLVPQRAINKNPIRAILCGFWSRKTIQRLAVLSEKVWKPNTTRSMFRRMESKPAPWRANWIFVWLFLVLIFLCLSAGRFLGFFG